MLVYLSRLIILLTVGSQDTIISPKFKCHKKALFGQSHIAKKKLTKINWKNVLSRYFASQNITIIVKRCWTISGSILTIFWDICNTTLLKEKRLHIRNLFIHKNNWWIFKTIIKLVLVVNLIKHSTLLNSIKYFFLLEIVIEYRIEYRILD